ncbi:radical SAM/SPASM domain-containing protein [Rhodobium gokarnense]|uniref:Radical SAM core domain-containing protein n=1 Tax=Rhodobium gokarnense TaxID=364296 RepID=A0ABT3HD95_9HYPH|nr:radical SAM protein [Rhodobium gokarnense]MCW2308382.1 uncharacterized protein [Rhodobium gokarnense]
MKASRYNVWSQLGSENQLLYNVRTNALLRLSPAMRQRAESFLACPAAEPDADFEKDLVRFGFATKDDGSELASLKAAERVRRFDTRVLGLTICTTLACNLRCVYCYQKKSSDLMSADIQSKVVDFVESQAAGLSGLQVVYFGGEPLVGRKVITSLAAEFKRLAKQKEFAYSAAVITNGYLLTARVAEELADCGVTSAQVTLDGPRRIHDTRRPREHGRGSFDRILENLAAAVDHIGAISVRVNVDKTNIDAIPELLDELERAGLRDKLRVYYAVVDSVTEACKDYGCNCFDKEEFARELTGLQMLSLERGFVIDNFPAGGMGCGAISLNAYVVAPDGTLYKCYNQTGVAGQEVGHIDGALDESRLSRWLAYDLFEYPDCRECTNLPLCLGSCPLQAVETGQPECPSISYGLEDTLKMELLNRRFRQARQANETGETHGERRSGPENGRDVAEAAG